jgi:hypothetical protein
MTALQTGDLSLFRATLANVYLARAHVSGVLSLIDSKVTGRVDCYGPEVAAYVTMRSAVFGGDMVLRAAKIGSDLILSNGHFQHTVDLTGAEIGGALHLDAAEWSPNVMLLLRNAKVDRIPSLADAWAERLDVNGFTYRFAGTSDQFKTWFRKADHYEPQPYEQLASVVQSQGNGSLATEVRWFGLDTERHEANGWRWVWLILSGPLVGYGYYPQYAFFWALELTMLGVAVLAASGEGPRTRLPFGFAYSFDMLLPGIRLRDRHYQIDLKGWARYYFYAHKIMGFVLASFLIASLALLSK